MNAQLPRTHRAVLDTSVLLSALVFSQGRLVQLRHAWQAGRFTPVASRDTVAELASVLAYRKFGLDAGEQHRLLGDYLPYIETHVLPDPLPPSVWPPCRDAGDQIFLDLAQSARVDVLVSGDQDLLALDGQAIRPTAPCRILTAAAFLDLLHAP